MTLSDRQVRILEFIQLYLEEHSYPPTIREIGKAVGIPSTSVVKYNLERLQEKGHIERSEEVSRGLRLKDWAGVRGLTGPRLVSVPKLGVISAGKPIAAMGQQEDPFAGETLTLTADLVPDAKNLYTLQVKGDSMIVAWIRDREETTLKYYHPEGSRIRLQPANPAYEPIYVDSSQLEIQGRVVAVLRQLT
jgi:repressor LexA